MSQNLSRKWSFKSTYNLVKTNNRVVTRVKINGIRVARIRRFPFSCDCAKVKSGSGRINHNTRSQTLGILVQTAKIMAHLRTSIVLSLFFHFYLQLHCYFHCLSYIYCSLLSDYCTTPNTTPSLVNTSHKSRVSRSLK